MSGSEDSSSLEVTWQVAWFALLALGLTAMTQPCGNVLCIRAKNHRFYIRASPIVCIFDVVQFLVFVVLGFSLNPKVWLQNIKFELKERFDGESGARDLKAAEQSIIVRWILMILGGSQFQLIKLMSMQGIPWTQAWAMMFFISIICGEILILLVRVLSLDNSSENTFPPWRSYKISDALDRIAFIPISLHFTLCYAALLALQAWLYDWLGDSFESPGIALIAFVFACAVTFNLILYFPLYFLVRDLFLRVISHTRHIDGRSHPLQRMISSKQRIYSLGCFGLISFFLFTPYVIGLIFGMWSPIWLRICLSFSFCVLLWEVANTLPLFIPKVFQRRVFRVDSFQGSQAVFLTLLTFLASIFHYGVVFDSSGTVNPEWTGTFGR